MKRVRGRGPAMPGKSIEDVIGVTIQYKVLWSNENIQARRLCEKLYLVQYSASQLGSRLKVPTPTHTSHT